MVRNAAATYAPKNVRINCVVPGLMRSPASAEAQEDWDMIAKTSLVST
jgi:NAD(P)-dependent dehydrogenase (short-subunit alcohol dehydrogenase family)